MDWNIAIQNANGILALGFLVYGLQWAKRRLNRYARSNNT